MGKLMAAMPILMIPGLNATARVFEAEMETLYRFGAVMIADHRDGASMREIAASILSNAPPRFVLGGFSMGGYVAFEIVRQAPERVAGLMLIDTSARPDTAEATANRLKAMELAKSGKFSLAAANAFPNAVHPSNVENAELKAIHLAMADANGPEVYVRQQEAIIGRPDSRPDLARISVPTLVVVGEADQIATPEAAREMAEGLADARLVTIANAGHLAVLEEPAQVNAALADFLGGD
jgi:pimeloyl-ACP methyl ester carboxylesterase